MIKVAFSKTDITPKLPCHLAGFLKERIAVKVHDSLYARAILFYDDNTYEYYLFIQFDLIAVDYHLKNKIEKKVHNFINPEHIVLCATHTHAGPMGVVSNFGAKDVFGEINDEYLEEIATKIVNNLLKIKDELLPCSISFAHSKVFNVGNERHDPKLSNDNNLFYLELVREDKAKAFIYNYACHPTVTGANNIQITKDLPCLVEDKYKDELCIFINSNAGNISTRFTRISSDFNQIEIYSKELIKAIDDARNNLTKPELLNRIEFKLLNKEYKLKQFRYVEEIERSLIESENKLKEANTKNYNKSQIRLIESIKEGAIVELQLLKYFNNQKLINATLTFIQFNNLKIAGIPGELFSTLGLSLKKRNIEVFGYTNGYLLYLADEKAYDNNFYEAISSPLSKGSAEKMIEDIIVYFDKMTNF